MKERGGETGRGEAEGGRERNSERDLRERNCGNRHGCETSPSPWAVGTEADRAAGGGLVSFLSTMDPDAELR